MKTDTRVRIVHGGRLPIAGMTGAVVAERAIPWGGRDYTVRLDGDLPSCPWGGTVAREVHGFQAGDLVVIEAAS